MPSRPPTTLNPPTVRLRDVARACGLHTSTICLALKNAPSIPEATRRRIQAAAQELGYRPNVAARHLALLRSDSSIGGSLPIAWINQEPDRHHWHTNSSAKGYRQAAHQRAEELGYHLEDLWSQQPGMTPARLCQIVTARGIAGVLFPVHHVCDLALLRSDWSECSLIGLNDHRLAEWVDVVSADHYANTDRMLRRLRQLGFRRIGLVLELPFDAATQGRVYACFARHQRQRSEDFPLPVCFLADATRHQVEVQAWLAQYQPDAVVGHSPTLVEWVRPICASAAVVQLHGPLAGFDAGTEEAAAEVAQAALEALVEKMRRFEHGSRTGSRLHLIKGRWQEVRLQQLEHQPVVA